MNIFYLHHNPKTCAEYHNDKHCVKMILEYGQLMSTAHRILDGTHYYGKTANGRNISRWLLEDPVREAALWKASHINHPSAVWTRESRGNYYWLYHLWTSLMDEYHHRYGKQHSARKLMTHLVSAPQNIPSGLFTQPTPAMPDDCKVYNEVATDRFTLDSIASYRNYYNKNKTHLAKWKNRPVPIWYVGNIES